MDRPREAEALRAAALAVSGAEGDAVFGELVQVLARILDVQATMISVFTDGRRSRMRALATWLGNRLLSTFEYDLACTPCATMVGREFRYVGRGASGMFAAGTLFHSRGIDGYSAYSLNGRDGVQLGLIVAMDSKPLPETALVEALLKIFAVRAVAEIERVRAETALEASEASYRAIFEASEDTIFVHDWETGAILEANARAAEMFGYSVEQLRRATMAQLSAPEAEYSQERALERLAQARSQAAPLRFEWRGRHRDGHLLWLEVTLKAATLAGERRLLAFVRDITERKAANEALAASEAQYRAIFNASADALVLWDSSLQRVDVNPAYERMFGFRRDEVVGRGYEHRAVSPKYAERRLELVRRSLAGETCCAELEAMRKNGERFAVDITTIPFTHRGEPHVLAIARDITARRSQEQLLRASEEQYRAIFNATADSLVLRDADFRVVDVNPAYVAISGYSREEVLGVDRVVANTLETSRIRALHARALAGEPIVLETQRICKDGTHLDVEVRGVPMEYRGRPHVLYIGRDIGERKRAEDVLRASEEQYRAIFNATTEALVLRDAETRVVDVNPAFLKMSGFTREEVIHERRWFFASPTASGLARHMFDRVIGGESVHFEVQGVRKSGSPLHVEMHAVPMMYRGKPHALGMARDITAQKLAEEQRAALEAQLSQARRMEAIGRLTGGIAHDFNNLLASTMGYVALAAERAEAAGDRKLGYYLEQSLASSRKARDLIQQMLTFSRGQRGAPRPVDLAQAVPGSLALMRGSLPATLEVRTDVGAAPVEVLVDPVQLDQVLLNLAINARDAMDGHGALQIEVHAPRTIESVCASCRQRFAGRFVELAVSDSGPGVAPEVLERMFEPFFTTKEVGRGSGMGLATVHGIVHEHRGHIVVQNGLAAGGRRGCSFRILLPPLAAGAGVAADAPLTAPKIGRRQPLRGRVLLVDDEATIADFMRELLAGWGLEVTAVTTPHAALEAFSADPQSYDLVITDLAMPRTTGFALARELLARRPGLPVILSTGHIDPAAWRDLEAAGIRALLHKPVEPEALYGLLRTHLH
jgi:PAS domain S-box-containing protein